MKLDRKLCDVPDAERGEFLIWKYRELRLIHRIDAITDKFTDLSKLMDKSLAVLVKIFKCEIACFKLNDAAKRSDGGFFVQSKQEKNTDLIESAGKILQNFLSEPQIQRLENEPSDDLKNVGFRNFLIIPMVITTDLAGVFLIANRESPFDENDIHFLRVISSQLDNAVIYGRSREEHRKTATSLKQRARELNILYEMSLSLGLGYDFENLSKKVLESAMQLVNIDRSSIMIYDPKNDELKTEVVCGEKQKIKLVKLSMGKGIAGLAMMSGQPLLVPMGSEDERFIPFEFPGIKPKKIYSLLCIPLMGAGKPLGVMNFSMLSRKKAFTKKDSETLSVAANLVALAIQRQHFYQMSIKDELTGLYSFRYFKERLMEEVLRAKRYKMIGSLVIFDLDRFKSINDNYGHPFGNVVLKAVAEILRSTIRQGVDLACRFGGEEMALVLPHTPEEGGMILAERIRQKVEGLKLAFEGKFVPVTISGGVSGFPTHGEEAEVVLKKADTALYHAKERGRNRIIMAEK